jgi:VIT1/CCC1 family predicted Fe2+/Mn2+ transporter
MGTGAYLASRAANQLFNREIRDEEDEIARRPSVETDETAILLEDEGIEPQRARTVADGIASSPTAFAKTKVEKELGLIYGRHQSEGGDALVVGAAYAVAALIPLWPYFLWPSPPRCSYRCRHRRRALRTRGSSRRASRRTG